MPMTFTSRDFHRPDETKELGDFINEVCSMLEEYRALEIASLHFFWGNEKSIWDIICAFTMDLEKFTPSIAYEREHDTWRLHCVAACECITGDPRFLNIKQLSKAFIYPTYQPNACPCSAPHLIILIRVILDKTYDSLDKAELFAKMCEELHRIFQKQDTVAHPGDEGRGDTTTIAWLFRKIVSHVCQCVINKSVLDFSYPEKNEPTFLECWAVNTAHLFNYDILSERALLDIIQRLIAPPRIVREDPIRFGYAQNACKQLLHIVKLDVATIMKHTDKLWKDNYSVQRLTPKEKRSFRMRLLRCPVLKHV